LIPPFLFYRFLIEILSFKPRILSISQLKAQLLMTSLIRSYTEKCNANCAFYIQIDSEYNIISSFKRLYIVGTE